MRIWRWVSSLLLSLVLVVACGARADASPRVTGAQLKNGPVPALCGHDRGRLRNGALFTEQQEVASGTGNVWYITSALGKVSPKTWHGAAAIIRCNAGGVPWPDNIVFYAPGPKVLGSIDLGSVFADIGDEERPIATKVTVGKGVTTVWVVGIAQDSQSPDFGTAKATIRIALRKGVFSVVSRVIHDDVYAAKHLLLALKSGKVARVKAALGGRGRAASALVWYRSLGKDKKFYRCKDRSDYSTMKYRWKCLVGASGRGYLSVGYNNQAKNYRIMAWGIEGR